MFRLSSGWLLAVLLVACESETPAVAPVPTVPTDTASVQAVESDTRVALTLYFWYGCPHCFAFRHYLQPWLAEWEDKIAFKRVPIALKPSWIDHARAFYAAQQLGVLPRFHPAVYDALHVQKRPLNSVEALADFAGSLGIDVAAFRNAMLSSTTTAAIQRDNAAVKRLAIRTTPTLVIGDQQLISLPSDEGYDALLHVTEEMLEQRLAR